MRWPCKSCALVGREPLKPMNEFGVHSPADFAQQLLPQGAWTRCSHCESATPALPAEGSPQPNESNHQDTTVAIAIDPCIANLSVHQCVTCGNEKGKVEYWEHDWARRSESISCKTCQPKMPSERNTGQGHLPVALIQRNEVTKAEASVRKFFCTVCEQDLVRDSFWASDVNNRSSCALQCKICRPTAPSERAAANAAAKVYKCELCMKDKVRDEFWHHDLRSRWGTVLGCKLCKPIPPNERKRGIAATRAKASPLATAGESAGVSTASTQLLPFHKRRRSKGPEIYASSPAPTRQTVATENCTNTS